MLLAHTITAMPHLAFCFYQPVTFRISVLYLFPASTLIKLRPSFSPSSLSGVGGECLSILSGYSLSSLLGTGEESRRMEIKLEGGRAGLVQAGCTFFGVSSLCLSVTFLVYGRSVYRQLIGSTVSRGRRVKRRERRRKKKERAKVAKHCQNDSYNVRDGQCTTTCPTTKAGTRIGTVSDVAAAGSSITTNTSSTIVTIADQRHESIASSSCALPSSADRLSEGTASTSTAICGTGTAAMLNSTVSTRTRVLTKRRHRRRASLPVRILGLAVAVSVCYAAQACFWFVSAFLTPSLPPASLAVSPLAPPATATYILLVLSIIARSGEVVALLCLLLVESALTLPHRNSSMYTSRQHRTQT